MERANPLLLHGFKPALASVLMLSCQALLADTLTQQSTSATQGLGIDMYSATSGQRPPVWSASYPLTRVVSTPEEAVLNPRASDAGPFLSRYNAHAPAYQLDPFSALVSVTLDSSAYSVRDAVTRVLDFLGYRLMESGPNVCPFAKELLASPLPAVHRQFEGVPAREVLHALAGPGYVTVVDHVRRKVTFDAHPDYSAHVAGGGGPAGVLTAHEHGGYVRSSDPVTTRPTDPSVSVDPAWYQTPYTLTPSALVIGPELDYEAPRRDFAAPIHPKTPLRSDAGIDRAGSVTGVRDRNGAPVVDPNGRTVGAMARQHPPQPVAPVALPNNVIVKEWRYDDGGFVRETMITSDPAATEIYLIDDTPEEAIE